MLQAMKNPAAKSAVDKEWEKLKKLPAWPLSNVKSKKGSSSGSTKRQKENPLCYIDEHQSSQEGGIRIELPEVQKTSRAPR